MSLKQREAVPSGRHRVLIVEDSAAMRRVVINALRSLPSVEVDESPDGVDALRKLRRREYDLLLVDLNMPRIGGLKLIPRVRADESGRRIQIVVITGDLTGDLDRARALGADHVLPKPIKGAELLELVRRVLAERDGAP